MTVFVAVAVTESSDRYVWVYAKEPTRDEVIERVYELEMCEDLDWYMDTTSVAIYETEVIE
jgi:hypothetical protein